MIQKINSKVEFTLLIYRLYELTHPITCLNMHSLDLFMHHYSTGTTFVVHSYYLYKYLHFLIIEVDIYICNSDQSC